MSRMLLNENGRLFVQISVTMSTEDLNEGRLLGNLSVLFLSMTNIGECGFKRE